METKEPIALQCPLSDGALKIVSTGRRLTSLRDSFVSLLREYCKGLFIADHGPEVRRRNSIWEIARHERAGTQTHRFPAPARQ